MVKGFSDSSVKNNEPIKDLKKDQKGLFSFLKGKKITYTLPGKKQINIFGSIVLGLNIVLVLLVVLYLNNQELRVNNLTRTMTWIDAGTFKSLLLASNLICNLEEIQSYKISCPEEVAYKNGWIDKEQLLKLAATYPKGEYQSYLNLLPSYE